MAEAFVVAGAFAEGFGEAASAFVEGFGDAAGAAADGFGEAAGAFAEGFGEVDADVDSAASSLAFRSAFSASNRCCCVGAGVGAASSSSSSASGDSGPKRVFFAEVSGEADAAGPVS